MLIDYSAVSEMQTMEDSSAANEKALIVEAPIVPGKAVGSKLISAGEYPLFCSMQPVVPLNPG